MTDKLLKLVAAAAIAMTPLAAWSQTNGAAPNARYQNDPSAASSDKDSPKMQQPGTIQKQTEPQKNGTNQSGSVTGTSKNGQPTQMQKPGAIQKQTNPQKNGRNQSESVNGMNKNGQPQQ